jgi:hypothetical protein
MLEGTKFEGEELDGECGENPVNTEKRRHGERTET